MFQAKGVRWILQGILAIAILAFCFDYGKHLVLKRVLEKEITESQGLVSFGALTVSPWPLFQSHLVFKDFHINILGTPLAVKSASIRQGWLDWRLAHIHAADVTFDGTVHIQKAHGILDASGLKERVDVSQLTLTGIQAHLPLLDFSGAQASFQFFYEMASQHLSLTVDAPEMAFLNGATFGLSGDGVIEAKYPVQGKMNVKIKNIDKMMKELVAVGAIEPSQADIVTAGSNFLGNLGLHDITLPLTIKDGDVSLGPLALFKVGKDGTGFHKIK